MKGLVMRLFGFSDEPTPEMLAKDRVINSLSARLKSEAVGLRRDKITLRNKLMEEMVHGSEQPPNDFQ